MASERSASVVLEKLVIRGLRGVDETTIDGFAPLTVIVGRNGSRKSTILEALLLAAAPSPENALTDIVNRRRGVENGLRWLFARGEVLGDGVHLEAHGRGHTRCVRLTSLPAPDPSTLKALRQVAGAAGPFTTIRLEVTTQTGSSPATAVLLGSVASTGEARYRHAGGPNLLPELIPRVRSIFSGPSAPGTIADAYTSLRAAGRAELADQVLAVLVDRGAQPGEVSLSIGSEQGRSFLMLSHSDRGVPIAVAGDGARELVENAIHYAEHDGGLTLHEEPEVHLHPGAQRVLAGVIARAVRRGTQVVLTTHSLEFIDDLLAEFQEDLSSLAVITASIVAGRLRTTSIPGEAADRLRSQIGEDLR